MGDRPRPDLPHRPQAEDGDLGLFRRAPAPGPLRRPGADAQRGREGKPGGRPRAAAASGRDQGPQAPVTRGAGPGLAHPRADLGLVGALAAGLSRLVTFRGCMKFWSPAVMAAAGVALAMSA